VSVSGSRLALGALGALLLLGCGVRDEGSGSDGSGGGGSNDVVLDPAYSAPNPDGFGGSLREGTFGDGSCSAYVYEAEVVPADLYVMFDSSGSMDAAVGGTKRIDAVRGALVEFVGDPGSAGLGIGLGVFGHLQLGFTSCDPGDYDEPVAPFGLLPGYRENFELALDVLRPIGETPTGAALRGACEYVGAWRRSNADHYTAVVLVTDGIPEASVTPNCDPTLPDAVTAATQCRVDDISVYVVGVGDELDSLTQIADAGGTERAYLVENDDVTGAMLQALDGIRGGAPLQCEFRVPEPDAGQSLDLGMVNVRYVDPEDEEYDIYYADGVADCDPAVGGWYYDDPISPTRLVLCPATCERITAEVHGVLGVAYGCATLTLPE
jgi:hypothetical protein